MTFSPQQSTTDVETSFRSQIVPETVTYSGDMSGVLDQAWYELRSARPEIPPVIMLVLSARECRRRGHFCMDAWRQRSEEHTLHEVAVHPGMFESPKDLLVTMVHEAAHSILWERRQEGDKHCCGVSLSGYYHRVEFRLVAEGLGLDVGFLNRRYGFTLTDWPVSGVPSAYQTVLEILGRLQVVATKRLPSRPGLAGRGKALGGGLVLGCRCRPIRKLRVPRGELQRGSIVCGECEMPFVALA